MSGAGACLNCGAPLAGPYCAQCGQKHRSTDLTLRAFLHETTEELTHWDGKVPSTLKALFLEPGLLTQDVLAGRRGRWLPPLRLYLICSIAFFLSQPLAEAISHREAREVVQITVTDPDGSTTLTPETRRMLEESWFARLYGAERLERAVVNSAQMNRAMNSALPKAMFVLLPLFAGLTQLAWRRRVPHYPAHLYLALHLHAAWFGMLTLTTLAAALIPSDLAGAIIGLVGLSYMSWYGVAALRRVFGDSWATTMVKTAGVTAGYLVGFLPVSLGLLAYALATM